MELPGMDFLEAASHNRFLGGSAASTSPLAPAPSSLDHGPALLPAPSPAAPPEEQTELPGMDFIGEQQASTPPPVPAPASLDHGPALLPAGSPAAAPAAEEQTELPGM